MEKMEHRDKVTVERDRKSDAWETETWKESDTESIVRTSGKKGEGISHGNRQRVRDAGRQGWKETDREMWE